MRNLYKAWSALFPVMAHSGCVEVNDGVISKWIAACSTRPLYYSTSPPPRILLQIMIEPATQIQSRQDKTITEQERLAKAQRRERYSAAFMWGKPYMFYRVICCCCYSDMLSRRDALRDGASAARGRPVPRAKIRQTLLSVSFLPMASRSHARLRWLRCRHHLLQTILPGAKVLLTKNWRNQMICSSDVARWWQRVQNKDERKTKLRNVRRLTTGFHFRVVVLCPAFHISDYTLGDIF